jgi:hypothetical protein
MQSVEEGHADIGGPVGSENACNVGYCHLDILDVFQYFSADHNVERPIWKRQLWQTAGDIRTGRGVRIDRNPPLHAFNWRDEGTAPANRAPANVENLA